MPFALAIRAASFDCAGLGPTVVRNNNPTDDAVRPAITSFRLMFFIASSCPVDGTNSCAQIAKSTSRLLMAIVAGCPSTQPAWGSGACRFRILLTTSVSVFAAEPIEPAWCRYPITGRTVRYLARRSFDSESVRYKISLVKRRSRPDVTQCVRSQRRRNHLFWAHGARRFSLVLSSACKCVNASEGFGNRHEPGSGCVVGPQSANSVFHSECGVQRGSVSKIESFKPYGPLG